MMKTILNMIKTKAVVCLKSIVEGKNICFKIASNYLVGLRLPFWVDELFCNEIVVVTAQHCEFTKFTYPIAQLNIEIVE